MCDHCVIESVKQRMLSRRDLLRAAPAAAVAATAGVAAAPPALAAGARKMVDLTHELHHDFPTYFGELGITLNQ